jgi:hypothetical protein
VQAAVALQPSSVLTRSMKTRYIPHFDHILVSVFCKLLGCIFDGWRHGFGVGLAWIPAVWLIVLLR